MSSDEIATIVRADDPQLVHKYLELHRERLVERLALGLGPHVRGNPRPRRADLTCIEPRAEPSRWGAGLLVEIGRRRS